uniref:Uncharacterized protein n=1 Tax=Rhizophagus irregularis (strain DAOM 181602 / DAOM 197198 / MUCL 43194) TaxID=747089 RepID=U9TLC6_RHIID
MVRYRDLLSLTENHTLSWIDLYNQHLVEINDDSNDSIGPAVDDIQEVEVAPTGVNIEGTLSVPIFGVNVELEGESLKRLQRKLKYIEYFIIEMSMLPPVCDVPIVFSGLSKSDHLSKVVVSSQFQEIYKLRLCKDNREKNFRCHQCSNNMGRTEVDKINLNKLRLLNQPVAKIHAVHTSGSEASKACRMPAGLINGVITVT